jgi:hypothetical protein
MMLPEFLDTRDRSAFALEPEVPEHLPKIVSWGVTVTADGT